MKIAICFYGLHPDETWKSTNGIVNVNQKKDKCYDHWNNNVFKLNNCDIFMHSFSTKHEELLKYKPKKHLFEDVSHFDNNIVDIKKKEYYYKMHNYKCQIPVILYVSYGIKKSVDLMLDYSNENNVEYDLILISRIDVCWLNPLFFNELNTDKFYSAVWGKNNYHGKRTNGFQALWFCSNKKNIIEFSKIYDNIYDYFKNDYSWHTITKTHTNTFINDDEVEYKFNDIDNIPIHMGQQRQIYK
jgi:hypothetical protein